MLGSLLAGDELNTPVNGRTAIQAAQHYIATLRSYDLTVDTIHTYYVLARLAPVLVHNNGPCAEIPWSSSRVGAGG